MDLRRVIVIVIIAVLFPIFTNTLADAIFHQPDYNDYCKGGYAGNYGVPAQDTKTNCTYREPTQTEKDSCGKGNLQPTYDTNGCIQAYHCETCDLLYNDAQATYNFMVFLVTSILGLIAIIFGIYLPAKTHPLHEMVGTGFMLGGLISIFVGTARFFGDLHKILRPIVIFIEMLLVIWIAYKKFQDNKKETTEGTIMKATKRKK
jgi:hypothetical protein